jgi:hypothetical protein
MQQAFGLQLQQDADVKQGCFAGRVEHVDSGRCLRFRTLEEFLAFIEAHLTDSTLQQDFEEKPNDIHDE